MRVNRGPLHTCRRRSRWAACPRSWQRLRGRWRATAQRSARSAARWSPGRYAAPASSWTTRCRCTRALPAPTPCRRLSGLQPSGCLLAARSQQRPLRIPQRGRPALHLRPHCGAVRCAQAVQRGVALGVPVRVAHRPAQAAHRARLRGRRRRRHGRAPARHRGRAPRLAGQQLPAPGGGLQASAAAAARWPLAPRGRSLLTSAPHAAGPLRRSAPGRWAAPWMTSSALQPLGMRAPSSSAGAGGRSARAAPRAWPMVRAGRARPQPCRDA